MRAPTRVLSRDDPGSPTRVLCALGWRSWVLARCRGAQRVHALRAHGRAPRDDSAVARTHEHRADEHVPRCVAWG
jgi:hypothetical protein